MNEDKNNIENNYDNLENRHHNHHTRNNTDENSGMWNVLKKLTKWQILTVALLVIVSYVLINGGFNYLTEKSKENLKNEVAQEVVSLQNENKRIKDSINKVEQIRLQELSRINIDKIYELMDEVHKEIPEANTIAVYYVHDSGGVPLSGGSLNVTVLYEKRSKGIPSLKKFWKAEPVPEGYFYFNKFIYDYGEKYINDVTNYSKIYVDDTKVFLRKYKAQSMYGVFLDQSTGGTYYLSFGFPEKDPFIKNEFIRYSALEYAKKLRPLLQLKQAPLEL